jgi:hypothetical protein
MSPILETLILGAIGSVIGTFLFLFIDSYWRRLALPKLADMVYRGARVDGHGSLWKSFLTRKVRFLPWRFSNTLIRSPALTHFVRIFQKAYLLAHMPSLATLLTALLLALHARVIATQFIMRHFASRLLRNWTLSLLRANTPPSPSPKTRFIRAISTSNVKAPNIQDRCKAIHWSFSVLPSASLQIPIRRKRGGFIICVVDALDADGHVGFAG